MNFHLKNSIETSVFLQFEVSDTKRIAKTRSSTATAIPFTHFCIGYWSCHPKKVLDNDWETSASSIIIAFFRRNCICKNWIPVLSAHPRNGGTTTLWKTSKRAIPLSPLVLPNNCVLLWKTISHSSKCLYTLTFVCSYLFFQQLT